MPLFNRKHTLRVDGIASAPVLGDLATPDTS
jgi:hypothetical protein